MALSPGQALRKASKGRRQAPLRVALVALPATKSRNSLTGSAPSARAMATNSTTSIRRSPPSYLAMNDWGRPSFLASACWRMPAFFRTATRVAINRAYSADLRDFCMHRQAKDSAASNLILKPDYPKTGYFLFPELSDPCGKRGREIWPVYIVGAAALLSPEMLHSVRNAVSEVRASRIPCPRSMDRPWNGPEPALLLIGGEARD